MCSAKHLKSKYLCLRYKIMQKAATKDFTKTFPTYFSRLFLQQFSNRPYLNVKIILAYFWITETIYKFVTTSSFGYFSNTFMSFTCSELVRLFEFSK